MDEINETKLCKYCKTWIPKGAKVCPNCRKKQGGKLKWIIIAVVVVLVLFAIASGGDGNNQPQKETFFKVGETAELNNVRVTMTDYSESNGSQFNKPAEGNVFVTVEFEIENNTDKELTISSILSFDAYADDYALEYSLPAMTSATMEDNSNANQLDGSIAAGKKMKGVVAYEAPSDWKKIEIHFTDDVWSNNKFKFEITK